MDLVQKAFSGVSEIPLKNNKTKNEQNDVGRY
jgi:hypothetical protein